MQIYENILIFADLMGKMLEWLKRTRLKACDCQKRSWVESVFRIKLPRRQRANSYIAKFNLFIVQLFCSGHFFFHCIHSIGNCLLEGMGLLDYQILAGKMNLI